jgi:ABC-type glycerol-3-phosphate transport system substrate-binding protein
MVIAALFAVGQPPLTSEAAGENKLEVFSWWTSGGEAEALNGLFKIFKKQDPGVEIVEKYGIKVGDKMTFDEFFAACDKLKAAGISALGVGDSGIWASAELFENTLLGVIGPKGWSDLFAGAMQWDDPKVKDAMRLFAKMLNYVNPDHSAQS